MPNNEILKREYLKDDIKLDFSFLPLSLTADEKIEKLIDSHRGKCDVLLYNGKIVFSSLQGGIKISDSLSDEKIEEYKKQIFTHDFILQNQKNVNAFLNIEISENQSPKEIFVVNIINGNLFQHTYINVKADSNFVCFEKYISLGNSNLNLFRQIDLEKNAQINLVTLQALKSENSVFSTYADVSACANLMQSYINLNSGKVVNYENVLLKEKQASATVQNCTFASKTDFLPCLTEIIHDEKNTVSVIKNFAFVNDEAKVIADGINIIAKGKSKSNARQETKIYNLSPKATSAANPQLIIDDFDVKASHAAAVGNLDEQSIYYMMSRGIEKNQAKKMLILGLVNEILISVTDIQEHDGIIKMIEEKIKE